MTSPDLTDQELRIIWGGLGALCVIAFVLALWPSRKQQQVEQRSAFIESDGNGLFELADVETSADTFMHAKGSPTVAAKRVRHASARSGKPRAAK